jgi:hypothetical protein
MMDTSLFLLFLQEINSERRLISRRNPRIPASQLTKKQREITSAWCLLALLIKIVDIAHNCHTWLAIRVLTRLVNNDIISTSNIKAKMSTWHE